MSAVFVWIKLLLIKQHNGMNLPNTVIINMHNTSAFNVLCSCTFICSYLLISKSFTLVSQDTQRNNLHGYGIH
jgi:hypothetical protein